jgi:hypothetical protein
VGLGLWILCTLWLLPLRAWGEPVAIDIGGVTVQASPPPGWCVYPDATFKFVLQQYEKVDRTNVPHVFFGDCGQIDANTQAQARIRDFGYLGTPRDYLGYQVGDLGPVLDALAESLKAQDFSPETSSIRDKLNKAEVGIQVGEMRSLGLLGRDERAVYSGLLTNARTATEEYRQIGIVGITAVRGRLLFCYVYADYANDDTLAAVLARAQVQVAQLWSENP